jgi:CRP-like cAMP-binding protein
MPAIRSFKRGEIVYPLDDVGCSVGFILEGQCAVCRIHGDDTKTILNTLVECDSFGILSVFSKEEFPTTIFADSSCKILFFSKDQIVGFVNNYSQISLNLINFFAQKVVFLNKKIATFSSGSTDAKLASFLLCESKRLDNDVMTINFKKTANVLGCARASVYRAAKSLEEAGYISINERKIQIINKTELERISK